MPQHLILPEPRRLPSRRAGGAGGGAPARQQREHGNHIRQQLAQINRAPRRLDRGIDPNLVFKIRAASRPEEGSFERRGVQVLSESVDYTYFVLVDDGGSTLSQAIERYIRTGDLRSFFNLIDDIEPLEPVDRIGPGVSTIDTYEGFRVFDVAIWPASTMSEAQQRVDIFSAVLEQSGGTIVLRSVSARRTYLRVQISDDGLRDILDTSVVEQVRTPPVPYLDFRDWRNAGPSDISIERMGGEAVGVLDDQPATGHPLLDGLILSAESLSPDWYQWQAQGSHGTEVVGRVLYPQLHEELRDHIPLTAVGSVRTVRILELDPGGFDSATRFPTYNFPHEIIAEGIRHLHNAYGVKVFNLSVGFSEPFSELHVGPLTETIDDLVRELGVVIVVPTGNVAISGDARTPSGHHVIDDKFNYFFTPEHRLSEPAPAALALTVASIALSGAAADLGNRVGWRAVAEPGEASAFSRAGAGLGTTQRRMNKPDVSHYGGNVVLNDTGQPVRNEIGGSIVTTSTRGSDGQLFAAVNGTSFAAPAVARVAADIAWEYPDASANLIRALLATSAVRSDSASSIAEAHLRHWVYGFGIPSTDLAISSGSNRATMTYDGSMQIDTVQIHPLPVPELFRRGSGSERTISVALAFDPPVRRQRREYLAGTMKVDIYRDIDPDELQEMLIKQDPDDPNELIRDRRRLKLEPGSNSFSNATLLVRKWTARNSFINDNETFYAVVTHKAQVWARNDPAYVSQAYALAVTLDDRALTQANLRDLLVQHVEVPARVRIRG